jgi:hypothetical protein
MGKGKEKLTTLLGVQSKILTITFKAQWTPQAWEIDIPASTQKSGISADSVFIAIHEKLWPKSVLVSWLQIQRKWNKCLVLSDRMQTSLLSTVMLPLVILSHRHNVSEPFHSSCLYHAGTVNPAYNGTTVDHNFFLLQAGSVSYRYLKLNK